MPFKKGHKLNLGRKTQFCPQGHDTFICGRYSNNNCKQCRKDYQNAYYDLNTEKSLLSQKKWKQENREEYNAYQRELFHTNINHKLARRIRDRVTNVLKGKLKPASAVSMLGCSIDFLKQHLEAQFQEGMSWDNWNKFGWHIDHIIPLSSFDLTDPEQFAKATHYTNLQPLWAADNWSKGNRIR